MEAPVWVRDRAGLARQLARDQDTRCTPNYIGEATQTLGGVAVRFRRIGPLPRAEIGSEEGRAGRLVPEENVGHAPSAELPVSIVALA